jgi:hypothetical protein
VTAMPARRVVLSFLAAAVVACQASLSASPPAPPGAEEVRSFLASVAAAAASGDESQFRRFLEGGASYPPEDLAFIKSVEFWKRRPAFPVKRLGPDAFSINFMPEQTDARDGPATFRMRVTLPVRRGRDGQLRVLSRAETERLARLPLPEEPVGEVMAFDHPDEGSLRREPGRHYLAELQAAVVGEAVRLSLRFDPPLQGPNLRTDRPVSHDFAFGDEIRVQIYFDADASADTGFRMDAFYQRAQEVEKGMDYGRAGQIQRWRGLGVDKRLDVHGKKFVQDDGARAWGLRVSLSDVTLELDKGGGGIVRYQTAVAFEKTLVDPEITVADDVLTIIVPATLLPMKAGAGYRVALENNGGFAPPETARRGIVAQASR